MTAAELKRHGDRLKALLDSVKGESKTAEQRREHLRGSIARVETLLEREGAAA